MDGAGKTYEKFLTILVGGAISQRQGFVETINERIEAIRIEYGDHLNVELAKVKACTHFNDAGMIGAVAKIRKIK